MHFTSNGNGVRDLRTSQVVDLNTEVKHVSLTAVCSLSVIVACSVEEFVSFAVYISG